MSEQIRAVVFDLDDVIRYWDDDETAAIERLHGIDQGAIYHEALADGVVVRAVVGEITDEQWREGVAARLCERFGAPGERAARAWCERRGTVSPVMVALVRELRRSVSVALLSNATTRLSEDLASLGLDGEFDAIFNTALLGVAKPAPEIYELVGRTLGVTPAQWLFIDDREENVEGARACGVAAHCFRGHEGLVAWLAAFPELGLSTR